MIRKRFGLGAVVALVFAASCSNAHVGDYDDPAGPVGFHPTDGGGVDASSEAGIKYCPVTTCSSPWATCESSKFPCDVDLLNDDENCGECELRCIGENPNNLSKWTCVGGKCTFSCTYGRYDCDGDLSNGCEAFLSEDAENCGTCGNKCPNGFWCYEGICEHRCKVLKMPDECGDTCTDVRNDDYNCGRCGVECDPGDPTKPRLQDDMYYGCVSGQCGVAKCRDSTNFDDCNNDLADGCETPLSTTSDCGRCDNACAEGKTCASETASYRCLCNDGLTFCSATLVGGCKRLDDDPLHCGGCNHVCPGTQTPHFEPTCSFGVCGGKCATNYANCDGLSANGCEVNTEVDNRNCGGCGQACLPEQVCSGGKCLVAPCDPGTPGGTTK